MSEETAVAVRVEQSPAHLIEMAVEKGTDPANLEKLMDLQDRWEQKQAKIAFDEAVSRFQLECPPIVKQKSASFKGQKAYDYAGYEDIMHIIRQPLARCGLSLSFDSEVIPLGDEKKAEVNMLQTTCIVSGHGYERRASVTLPVPAEMRVNATQKAGAGLSYGKRYSLVNALNLNVVGEDSDAALLYESQNVIDDEQFERLSEMLDAAESNVTGTRDKFLNWLTQSTGAPKLRELPSKKYNMVYDALRAKLQAGDK